MKKCKSCTMLWTTPELITQMWSGTEFPCSVPFFPSTLSMHLIKTEILHRRQLASHVNAKITCSESTCCSHGMSKFFYADDSGAVSSVWITEAGIMQTKSWELGSVTIEQMCSVDSIYCCAILVRTSGGNVWRIKGGCVDREEEPAPKRPRLGDCERIYENNNLIWIQSHGTGFYGLLHDGRMVDWTQESETVLPRRIDGSFPAPVSATLLVEPSLLVTSIVEHLGLSRNKHTVLVGLEDGTLWGHSTDGEGTLITHLPAESISALHLLKLSGSPLFNALVVIGTCGTINMFTEAQCKKLLCEEFYIPTPVLSSRTAEDDEVLFVNIGGNIHLVEMVNVQKEPPAGNIALKMTRLDALHNIRQFHLESEKPHTGKIYLLSIEVQNSIVTLLLAQANMSEKISLDEDPNLIQDAIHVILKELDEQDKLKTDMQHQMEDLNNRLISVNQAIYSLQRIKSQKSKLQDKENDDASPFQCDVQPLVIMPNIHHLTGHSNCFLRVRIRTLIPLRWEQWHLHINLWHQRTLLQEKNHADTQHQDSTSGLTFTMPLAGVMDDEIWIRDFPIEIKDLQLPLRISIHLSLQLDQTKPRLIGEKKLSTLSEAMTPLLQQQQLGDWHSETNIGGQAGSKPALFPLTDLLLDDLHLSFPCSEDTLKVLKRNGIREATFRLCESMHSRRLLDNTNQYPFVHLEGARPAHLFGELITINLRFMMQPHDDDALNGIYDKFLYTFLQDAQTRKHMDRIMTSKNHAFFHLAAFPEYPVEMRLSRDQSSSNLFIMTISCYNDVALIKVETSLLARSQDFVVDSEEITDKGIHLHDAHWELLNASTNLEQRYRSNKNDPEFWKALKETVGHLKKLHDGLVIGPIWF